MPAMRRNRQSRAVNQVSGMREACGSARVTIDRQGETIMRNRTIYVSCNECGRVFDLREGDTDVALYGPCPEGALPGLFDPDNEYDGKGCPGGVLNPSDAEGRTFVPCPASCSFKGSGWQ